jgi:hypothetical protein
MTADKQIALSQTRKGRMVIHVLAYKRDRKLVWHLKGIMREVLNK